MLDPALLARFEEHMARPSIPVNFVAGSASRFLIRGPLILAGYSFREIAGLAASFSLRDGLDVGGTLVANGDVAANGMAQLQMGRDGPYCFRGIFVQMLSGSLDGSVWVKL